MKPEISTLFRAVSGLFMLMGACFCARADVLGYAVLSGPMSPFGVEDLTTGTFVQRGDIASSLGPNGGLNGLGEIGGSLYGIGNTASGLNNTLYRVNPGDASLTIVGSGSVGFGDMGSTTAGLYGLDYRMNLYSINPATGAATLIGPTGLALSSHGDLSTGAGTLYLFAQYGTSSPELYSLDTHTGTATLIGNTPAVFGMLYQGGSLYGESYSACTTNPDGICGQSIYAVNPATANSTFVSNVTGTNFAFDGLAPVPTTVPEPSSFSLLIASSLLGAGAGFVASVRRRASD